MVLHCGLHQTGSTYIQRNLKRKHDLLLEPAVQERLLFSRSEWTLFRNFLEKNFAKSA